MKRPNILIIMADQLSALALPFHGNVAVKAPYLQELANHSAVFDNAYCNFPLCSPARSSLMAGQFASRIGAFDNASEFPAATPTLPYYLNSLGYKTILSGKMHFAGPDQLHGFQQRLTTDIYPSDFAWTADWRKKEFEPAPSGYNLGTIDESGPCFRSLQLDYDEEVEAKSIQCLYDLARDESTDPFFLCASFTHPHPPFHILPEYLDRYQPEEINLPIVGDMSMEQRDILSRWIQFSHGLAEKSASEEQIRRARHTYYAMISYIDDKVGNLLRALKRSGLDENTIVVFTTDHGEMMGERGMWFKRVFFDWATKVPLLIRLPGSSTMRRIPDCASLVDLLPTLMDFCTDGDSTAWIDPIDGRSLRPLMEGASDPDQATAFVEYMADAVSTPCCMLRRGRYKLIYTHGHPDQLYDMIDDPNELHNIASSALDISTGLRNELLSWWDPEKIRSEVLASQTRRRFIKELPSEMRPPWDFQAHVDDTQRFVRRTSGLTLKQRSRWPRISTIKE